MENLQQIVSEATNAPEDFKFYKCQTPPPNAVGYMFVESRPSLTKEVKINCYDGTIPRKHNRNIEVTKRFHFVEASAIENCIDLESYKPLLLQDFEAQLNDIFSLFNESIESL